MTGITLLPPIHHEKYSIDAQKIGWLAYLLLGLDLLA